MTPIRWSDNDHRFGPFTFARAGHGYRSFVIMAYSGDEEDEPKAQAYLRLSMLGFTLICLLPSFLLQPFRKKVYPGSWDEATVARLGRNWYWATTERQYGFTYSDGHLSVHFGKQAMDSSIDQRWGCFLPWTQWRHVRFSLYGLDGAHVWTQAATAGMYRLGSGSYDRQRAAEDACPKVTFRFLDYDEEEIIATSMIQEREWRFGTGYFKWLSLFRRPKIGRSLDLRFSSEVGKRKGSWKGGTIGHSIDMLTGELHEAAFARYCAQNGLTFIEGSGTPSGGAPGHYLQERYGMSSKPSGWNDAVKGFFFRGPERRQPSEDFRSAFHNRAEVPPPKLWPAGHPRPRRRIDLTTDSSLQINRPTKTPRAAQ